jgi:hypothetical protein
MHVVTIDNIAPRRPFVLGRPALHRSLSGSMAPGDTDWNRVGHGWAVAIHLAARERIGCSEYRLRCHSAVHG